jgi:hypothetical protein
MKTNRALHVSASLMGMAVAKPVVLVGVDVVKP